MISNLLATHVTTSSHTSKDLAKPILTGVMLSTYHPPHDPTQFDHSPEPTTSYTSTAYYYGPSTSLYIPPPVQNYSSSKRVKIGQHYSYSSTTNPAPSFISNRNITEASSSFDIPPLVYPSVMTVASHTHTIQPRLHRASEPASPAPSSNPSTPQSSPLRQPIFSDNPSNDLVLCEDSYRLPVKHAGNRSYSQTPNQSPVIAVQYSGPCGNPDSLWTPYNPQFTTPSRQSSYRSNSDVNGDSNHNSTIPKLFRTVSDAVQDELFNPGIAPGTTRSSLSSDSSSPDRNSQLPNLFQQAQNQHVKKSGPTIGGKFIRDHSPFRANSPFHPARTHQEMGRSPPRTTSFLSTGPSFTTSARMRREKEIELEAEALREQMQKEFEEMQESPKTISPKDAYVEYHEPESNGIQGNLFASSQPEDVYSQSTDSSFENAGSSPPNGSPSLSPGPMQAGDYVSHFANLSQAQQPMPLGQQQQHLQDQYQQYSDIPTINWEDETSETSSRFSDENYDSTASPLRKPSETKANDGAYSCTVQGCTKRFSTPSKMAKHRRETHRSGTPMGGRDVPHKSLLQGPSRCARINPTTGKPCNTIFSRPYDLTRHEDTIHNVARPKVRCELCKDEKTFSRQDALTRHKKVKHGIDNK